MYNRERERDYVPTDFLQRLPNTALCLINQSII